MLALENLFEYLTVESDTSNMTSGKQMNAENANPKRKRRKKSKKQEATANADVTVLPESANVEKKPANVTNIKHKKATDVEKKPANVTNIKHKKATGSDNWKAFLESNPPVKQEPDEFTIPEELEMPRKSNCIAIDCEMVGIGEDKKGNMLARVSIVNSLGECLYDTFVKPTAPVTDYRTYVSGVRPEDIANAERFEVVQRRVQNLLKGRILVGHAVSNDLLVLGLKHPWHQLRDTSKYRPFHGVVCKGTPSLRNLTSHFLKVNIQEGEHSSVQDAQATMQLYMLVRKEWEAEMRKRRHYQYQKKAAKVKSKPKPTHRPRRLHRNHK